MAFEPVMAVLPARALLRDDGDWLIVDKPAGLGVHGGDNRLGPDLIARVSKVSGAPRERMGPPCFTLDAATSGLVAFARGPVARTVWIGAEQRGVRLSFLAMVEDVRLPVRGSLGNRREELSFEVLERGVGLALVRVRTAPRSGSALRAALARAGLVVVGDTKRSRRSAWRAMVHLEAVDDARLNWPRAPMPADWRLVIDDPRSVSAVALQARLFGAMWRRGVLAERCNTYRFVNDDSDGLTGVTVDRFAEWAVLSVSSEIDSLREKFLVDGLMDLGARGVYVKRRVRADLRGCDVAALAPCLPVMGDAAPSTIVVDEASVRLRVRLGDGLSSGLFVDQRENRMRLRGLVSRGQRLLNLFSYTCSFSVVAAMEGVVTTSVDLATPALDWGKENFVENGLDPEQHEFVRADARKWLDRARLEARRFHWIVLDPPSFSTGGRKGTFSVVRDYQSLAEAAFALLEPGGTLLSVTNHRKTSPEKLRRILEAAAATAGRRPMMIEEANSQLDCPLAGGTPVPSKSVWVKVA